jgi:hypothetical protein
MFELDRVDEGYVARAPHRFVHRISCSLSPHRAFDVITDPTFDKEWFPDFVSARWETPSPQGVGSLRVYRLKYMTIREEFLVWEPGKRLTFRLNQCSLPMMRCFVENYVLTSRPDGGTDLLWEVCYTPNPWISFLHPLVRPLFARDFVRATDDLRGLLERLAALAAPDSRRDPEAEDRSVSASGHEG